MTFEARWVEHVVYVISLSRRRRPNLSAIPVGQIVSKMSFFLYAIESALNLRGALTYLNPRSIFMLHSKNEAIHLFC